LEAPGVAPEPAGPVGGGEDDTGSREQGAAGGVEVVAVVVVAEQDRVDRAEVGGGDGWPGQLSGAGAPAEAVAAAGGSKVGSVNNRHPSTSIRAVPTSTLTVCRGPLRDGELTVTGGTHPVQATM
jgi:hypothetical protein